MHHHDTEQLLELVTPELDACEAAVRQTEPELPEPEVLDRALRRSLTQLRYELSVGTFAYLRWRVARARATTAERLATAAARLAESAAIRETARVAPRRLANSDGDPRGAGVGEGATTMPPGSPGPPRSGPVEPVDLGPPRGFRTAGGSTWSVQEIALGSVGWARAPRCLLFFAETAIRRVWHYPADWRALPDEALEALSWET